MVGAGRMVGVLEGSRKESIYKRLPAVETRLKVHYCLFTAVKRLI
jgi:hypothetical protein